MMEKREFDQSTTNFDTEKFLNYKYFILKFKLGHI